MKKIIYLFSALMLFISCGKDELVKSISHSDSEVNKKYFVTKDEAVKLAKSFHFFEPSKPNLRSSEITVTDIQAYEKAGVVFYWFINYEDGFLILSADKRQEAVLGFNRFGSIKNQDLPLQLTSLLSGESYEIGQLRILEIDEITEHVEGTWDAIPKPPDTPIDNDPEGPCPQISSNTVGPLIGTKWNQGCGYNDLCPLIGSSCGCSNMRAVTGCVATAMAQVMYYHKWPTSYNWSSMLLTTGSNETARLMKDIGAAVNMSYGCSSSANTQNKAAPAFKNDFGYASSTQYLSYNWYTVKTELNAGRPVMLRGENSEGGHAWVCEGYKSWDYTCSANTVFYMNWGWGGQSNGYFTYSDFLPWGGNGPNPYNQGKGMVLVRK